MAHSGPLQLYIGEPSGQYAFNTVPRHALPEARKFHAILLHSFSLLFELALADGIEEHDFIFF